jgi:PRTRC genetic system protein A
MGQPKYNNYHKPKDKTPTKPAKKERTPEEIGKLRRELFLNINSYHVGSYKEAVLDKLHNHVFQGDGDYLVVNNKIGKFIVKMNDTKHPGLPEEIGGNKIQLKVPKIPGRIYYQILAFFRDICDTMGNAEAFVQVYYDNQSEEYVCHVPEQTVSGGSVRYDATENLNEKDRKRYTFVFEIHSHNTMGAFWSGTDDADEKETKFYGVFGRIKSNVHEEKFRFMVMDKRIDVKKEHIFDFSEEEVSKEDILEYLEAHEGEVIETKDLLSAVSCVTDKYPLEWKDNVKQQTYSTNTYVGGTKKTYGADVGTNHAYNGYNSWGEEETDPWHSGNYKGLGEDAMSEYVKDTPNMQDFVDIEETFDIGEYEEDIHGVIIDTFAASLTELHVSVLLEALVDQGFDRVIQDFMR